MYNVIIEGAIGGLVYSLSGWANGPEKERFDWKKMVPTLIVAGVIGAMAAFTGQDYGFVANGAMAAGLTAVVQKFWQAFIKKVK